MMMNTFALRRGLSSAVSATGRQAARLTRSSVAVHQPAMATMTTTTVTTTPAMRLFSSSSSSPSLKDSYDNILVDKTTNPGVGIVTLHRPKALNALCDALFDDLLHAATALDQDDDVGCLILTGSEKGESVSSARKHSTQQTNKQTNKPCITWTS